MSLHVMIAERRRRSARFPDQNARSPQALSAAHRTIIEATIQARLDEASALIALLDRLDGDADFEPSNGSSNGFGGLMDQSEWASGNRDDLEQDSDDEPEDEFDDIGRAAMNGALVAYRPQ